MDENYWNELEKAKMGFYRTKVKLLRTGNPRKWHKELKKLTRFDQHQDEEIQVENIKEFTDAEQAELIANKFAAVSQEYKKLEKTDVKIPEFSESDIPVVTEKEVLETLAE